MFFFRGKCRELKSPKSHCGALGFSVCRGHYHALGFPVFSLPYFSKVVHPFCNCDIDAFRNTSILVDDQDFFSFRIRFVQL